MCENLRSIEEVKSLMKLTQNLLPKISNREESNNMIISINMMKWFLKEKDYLE